MWSLRPKCQRLRFTQKSFKSFKSFQSALEGDVSFVERAEVTEIGYALFAACMVLIIFMIIRNHSTKETATRSSLHNRGYERREHPPAGGTSHNRALWRSALHTDGRPLQGRDDVSGVPGCHARPGYGAQAPSASWWSDCG